MINWRVCNTRGRLESKAGLPPKAGDLTGLIVGLTAFVSLFHSIFAKPTFLGVKVIRFTVATREAHKQTYTSVSFLKIIKHLVNGDRYVPL